MQLFQHFGAVYHLTAKMSLKKLKTISIDLNMETKERRRRKEVFERRYYLLYPPSWAEENYCKVGSKESRPKGYGALHGEVKEV